MKEFFKRAVIFGLVNVFLIALVFLFNRHAAMPDYNVVYGTLATLVIAILLEPYLAIRNGERPDLERVGASIFGTLIAAGVVTAILMVAGVIV